MAMAVTVKFHVRAIHDYRRWIKRLERDLGMEGAADYEQEVMLALSESEGELPGAKSRATEVPSTRQYTAIFQRTLLEYQVRTRKVFFGLLTVTSEILLLEIQELPPDVLLPTARR
jgi:hypothetical protein